MKPAPDLPLTIIISGDTAGWIVPCGCASNQSGGLPRRGTFVEEQRKQGSVILAEVGGAASGITLYDKLKFEAIVRGEAAMDIAVHNIGQAEAQLGIDMLKQLHEKWETPWISANTTNIAGNPLVEPARMVTSGNRKILFIGVLSQQYATEEIRISPPLQAVLKVLQEQVGKYERAFVLAYMPENELWALAENLPEVDAVVGGPTGQPVPPTYPQGSVLVTSATKQGKFLVVLTLPANNEKMNGAIVELDKRFADDAVQVTNIQKFYAELRQRDLVPSDTPFVRRPLMSSEVFVGSRTCQDCHEDEYRFWRRTRHANAWESLVKQEAHRYGAQYDPDCQRCHVTGYGLLGGFETVALSNVALASERYNVGCESCHGGSAEHCKVTTVSTPVGKRANEQCLMCHDQENSPLFDFDTYWDKIKHAIVE